MAKITGITPHIERPFGCHVWKVELDLVADGATGTIDIPIDTLPIGTVIIDCEVVVTTASAGDTSAALDVEVGTAELLNCGADSLGTLNRTSLDSESGSPATSNTALAAAASVLNAEITIAGTATTAPVFYVAVTCGRAEY